MARLKQYLTIFNFVSAHIVESCNTRSLTNFQQFLMVLIKLRLNLFDQDLPYRFGISQSTVSRYFKKWITITFVRLQPLPIEFKKHFNRCVAIIDCFEVFCESPKSLKARAQTWSTFKLHYTIKVLIVITPQGVIFRLCRKAGVAVLQINILLKTVASSDTYFQEIRFYIVDRDFNIEAAVSLYCTEVKIPP